MEYVKARLGKWITAAIIIVVGILCIVAGAKLGGDDWGEGAKALDSISLVMGIVLVVVGSLALIMAGVVAFLVKKGFLAVGLPGAFLLAIGISLLPEYNRYAADLILLLLRVVPFILIVVGAVILIEGGLNIFNWVKEKGKTAALVAAIVIALIGVAAIVVGALCVGEDPVIKSHIQLIIFGIIVVLEGLLQLLTSFIKLPDAVVIVTKEEK